MSRPVPLLKLEEDAYYAVLRALAVNDLDWDKEKLLTDLRKILNITNDQHFKFLEEVTEDKLVTRLREARSNPVDLPVTVSHNMPPPRQHTSNANRKPQRLSGNLRPSPSPTAGTRPVRPPESLSGDLKRNRSMKRDRDEVFEPRKSLGQGGSRSIKASLGGRGRGRGRRIPGIPRETSQLQSLQAIGRKFKRIPFDPVVFRERLEHGAVAELEDMNAALLFRSQTIQKHMDLIKQLEDEHIAKKDPLKHCQLLIQELELTEMKINSELEALRSDNEDSA